MLVYEVDRIYEFYAIIIALSQSSPLITHCLLPYFMCRSKEERVDGLSVAITVVDVGGCMGGEDVLG